MFLLLPVDINLPKIVLLPPLVILINPYILAPACSYPHPSLCSCSFLLLSSSFPVFLLHPVDIILSLCPNVLAPLCRYQHPFLIHMFLLHPVVILIPLYVLAPPCSYPYPFLVLAAPCSYPHPSFYVLAPPCSYQPISLSK
jgi:hypothetical protein